MIGSLFSGIGGLELGLEWAGLGPVAFQVEIDPFCRSVLAKHWPTTPRFEDVKTVGKHNLPAVELLCGGFPCQDVSSAGPKAGLAGARSGLWYEYLRIVSELRPSAVVVENVASGKQRWLCEVRSNLHALGYRTRAVALSAADVGAPHLRKRIFVIAADVDSESQSTLAEHAKMAGASAIADITGERSYDQNSSNPSRRTNDLRSWRAIEGFSGGWSARHEGWSRTENGWCTSFGDVVPLVNGVSDQLAERRRCNEIKALGNAVVPQCAEVIGRMIVEGYV